MEKRDVEETETVDIAQERSSDAGFEEPIQQR